MSKTIFISNRLPVTVQKESNGIEYKKSIGGLATGLKQYHEQSDSLWIGWTGLTEEELTDKEEKEIRRVLKEEYQCGSVFLSEEELKQYYYGFCNKTIWPLFHYFLEKVEYNQENWDYYKKVNQKFFEVSESYIEDGDTIWIHDYQLMLLPQLIREKYPNTKIGFFLHIPFPSYEIFRLIIWREDILKGLLGADMIGFHTYDYVRHFLKSVKRIIGLDHTLNKINYVDRDIQIDAFPMGIDYPSFHNKRIDGEFQEKLQMLKNDNPEMKIISSVDRLDYTKGIPERIKGFGCFLETNPQYLEKIRLHLIVAPSRTEVDTYEELRKEITKLVSEVNGKYGSLDWMPIWFYFQSFSQEDLIALYRNTDVMLVTPLRDGMNLVSKEYIASRTDYEGMVVISETAGAVSELGEAVIVNPNDDQAIADGIKTALEMPKEEQIRKNKILHKRLQYYNVNHWAGEFLRTLTSIGNDPALICKDLNQHLSVLQKDYQYANKRIFFLDYDGTLVGFKAKPEWAKPDHELKELLSKLTADPKNTVVIISGRDRHTLGKWFSEQPIHLVADHGLWIKNLSEDWNQTVPVQNDWKDSVRNLMEVYSDRFPGSFIEEKEYSLAFHYRSCHSYMIEIKLGGLRDELLSMTSSLSLGLQEGKKVIEVKDMRVSKGLGASILLQNKEYDFIFGAGDDLTDEDLFLALPEYAYGTKIGEGNSKAPYFLKSWQSLRSILNHFAVISSCSQTHHSNDITKLEAL